MIMLSMKSFLIFLAVAVVLVFIIVFFFFDAKGRPYYGQLYDALLLSLLLLFLMSLVSAGVHLT